MDVETNRRRLDEAYRLPQVPSGGLNLDAMYIRQVFFGMGRHFDLTPTEALLLATVHSLSKDGRDWCYMSQAHLANALNISHGTINTLLEKLRSEDELLEKGSKHPRWGTIQWRLAPKARDRMRYIQILIAKSKAAKGI
jgi:CRP-like cAMP-binding protein